MVKESLKDAHTKTHTHTHTHTHTGQDDALEEMFHDRRGEWGRGGGSESGGNRDRQRK